MNQTGVASGVSRRHARINRESLSISGYCSYVGCLGNIDIAVLANLNGIGAYRGSYRARDRLPGGKIKVAVVPGTGYRRSPVFVVDRALAQCTARMGTAIVDRVD